jgi:hypothetical protein
MTVYNVRKVNIVLRDLPHQTVHVLVHTIAQSVQVYNNLT